MEYDPDLNINLCNVYLLRSIFFSKAFFICYIISINFVRPNSVFFQTYLMFQLIIVSFLTFISPNTRNINITWLWLHLLSLAYRSLIGGQFIHRKIIRIGLSSVHGTR